MRLTNRAQGDRTLILELTSMVDIVFLLVIFFMVTSDFARDARAEVSLPRLDGEQMEGMEEAGMYINLDEHGDILLSTSEPPVSLEALAERLSVYLATEGAPLVTLRADKQAPIVIFNEIVRVLEASGVSSVRMATEVPSRP
ncbi:MAG: hypothetical protein CMJ40_04570 [Phycisphaerae bacterium]|nr:hypothetical protein [Phycisphaerae bacterium]|tara:strand:- start:106 stop:531 length:426 start_codon:yes stop_codon:yes gene_type:complete